jgi:hypothetical protein
MDECTEIRRKLGTDNALTQVLRHYWMVDVKNSLNYSEIQAKTALFHNKSYFFSS